MEITNASAKRVLSAIYCDSPTNEDVELIKEIARQNDNPTGFAADVCEVWEIERRGNRQAIVQSVKHLDWN